MKTQYLSIRHLMYFILLALLITSCAQPNTEATRAKAAAVTLLGANTLQTATPELYAISKVVSSSPGAFMLFDDCARIAVFISPGGQTANGTIYYFAAFVDTVHTALIDANNTLIDFGIDPQKITTLEEMRTALRSRGFEELAPTTLPTLYGALKLGLGFIRSLGGTITDIMIMPTYMLTPDMLFPWVDPEWKPGIN